MRIHVLASISFLACMLMHGAAAQAQNHIGVILSGYEDNCQITHLGKLYDCDERRQIYLGDVIRKKPSTKALKIKWAPYVKGAPRGETFLEAVADRPETFQAKSYTGAAKEYLQDFVRPAEYKVTSAVTRDPRYRSAIPDRATLLPGYPMLISRDGMQITSLTILAADGKSIVEMPVAANATIVVSLEQLPLKPGESYSVQLRGDAALRKFTASVVKKELGEQVIQGLADIDREGLAEAEAVVRKAAYCQMISDLYPDTLDLYWLSFQLLRDSRATLTKEQEEVFTALRERYYSYRAGKE
jgi:hypothetical protein